MGNCLGLTKSCRLVTMTTEERAGGICFLAGWKSSQAATHMRWEGWLPRYKAASGNTGKQNIASWEKKGSLTFLLYCNTEQHINHALCDSQGIWLQFRIRLCMEFFFFFFFAKCNAQIACYVIRHEPTTIPFYIIFPTVPVIQHRLMQMFHKIRRGVCVPGCTLQCVCFCVGTGVCVCVCSVHANVYMYMSVFLCVWSQWGGIYISDR